MKHGVVNRLHGRTPSYFCHVYISQFLPTPWWRQH